MCFLKYQPSLDFHQGHFNVVNETGIIFYLIDEIFMVIQLCYPQKLNFLVNILSLAYW